MAGIAEMRRVLIVLLALSLVASCKTRPPKRVTPLPVRKAFMEPHIAETIPTLKINSIVYYPTNTVDAFVTGEHVAYFTNTAIVKLRFNTAAGQIYMIEYLESDIWYPTGALFVSLTNGFIELPDYLFTRESHRLYRVRATTP